MFFRLLPIRIFLIFILLQTSNTLIKGKKLLLIFPFPANYSFEFDNVDINLNENMIFSLSCNIEDVSSNFTNDITEKYYSLLFCNNNDDDDSDSNYKNNYNSEKLYFENSDYIRQQSLIKKKFDKDDVDTVLSVLSKVDTILFHSSAGNDNVIISLMNVTWKKPRAYFSDRFSPIPSIHVKIKNNIDEIATARNIMHYSMLSHIVDNYTNPSFYSDDIKASLRHHAAKISSRLNDNSNDDVGKEHDAFSSLNCDQYLSSDDKVILDNILIQNLPYNNNNKNNNNSKSNSSVDDMKILCMTYTKQVNEEQVRIIASTWGPRCDGYLAWSDHSDLTIPTIQIVPGGRKDWEESYNEMWAKSQAIWTIVESILIDDYDYFLIGGDDLYVIVENLRHYLSSSVIADYFANNTKPMHLGRIMRQNDYLSFISGGSGYILNKIALKVLIYNLHNNPACMRQISTSMEDLMVSNCLLQSGINSKPFDTRDREGRERFHPVNMHEAKNADIDWYCKMANNVKFGVDCCSKYSISFQNIKTKEYMKCVDKYLYAY